MLKFNNYISRWIIDFNIIFASGFAVILSVVALPAFSQINLEIQPRISPNWTNKTRK